MQEKVSNAGCHNRPKYFAPDNILVLFESDSKCFGENTFTDINNKGVYSIDNLVIF
jgi:hypothetical protein